MIQNPFRIQSASAKVSLVFIEIQGWENALRLPVRTHLDGRLLHLEGYPLDVLIILRIKRQKVVIRILNCEGSRH